MSYHKTIYKKTAIIQKHSEEELFETTGTRTLVNHTEMAKISRALDCSMDRSASALRRECSSVMHSFILSKPADASREQD